MQATRKPHKTAKMPFHADHARSTHIERMARAEFLLGVGRAEEALPILDRLHRSDDKHIGVLELLAKALWQKGDFDRLLPMLDDLIAVNPYEPGYFALRGAALQTAGKYGDAYAALTRCCELSQGEPDASVKSMMQDLQLWQSTLISQLLDDDPTFRLDYSRDPVAACRARGFEIERAAVSAAWVPSPADSAAVFVRPS